MPAPGRIDLSRLQIDEVLECHGYDENWIGSLNATG